MATKEEVKTFLSEHDFSRNYQRIHLGHGLYTPGVDRSSSFNLATAPIDMAGKSYLDVGCMWGAMVFMAKDRGAGAHGCDFRPHFLEVARGIAKIKDSSAEFYQHDIMKGAPWPDWNPGLTYDVVSMFNVIHHLEYPFLALHNALSAVDGYFIIEFPTLRGRWDKIGTGDVSTSRAALSGPYLGIISKETGLYFTSESMKIAVNWFGKWECVVDERSPYRSDRLLMTFRRV